MPEGVYFLERIFSGEFIFWRMSSVCPITDTLPITVSNAMYVRIYSNKILAFEFTVDLSNTVEKCEV